MIKLLLVIAIATIGCTKNKVVPEPETKSIVLVVSEGVCFGDGDNSFATDDEVDIVFFDTGQGLHQCPVLNIGMNSTVELNKKK